MSLRLTLPLVVILFSTASLLAGPREGTLDITWIDVEGGAATLIVTPAGETLLIDTGNPGRRDPERILKAVAEHGMKRIDHLVTTHYHVDHFGGAATLSELLPIGTVYDNGEFEGMPDRPDKAYREFKCEKRVVLNPGDRVPLKSGEVPLTVKCLGTRQSFVDAPAGTAANEAICADARSKARDGSDNANSIVLLVEFGSFRFFDAGDLTWNQEAKLVCPKNLVGKVDVYQVTHHGLDASNNPLVIRTLEPRVAIMNNGAKKGCLPEVFETLTKQKSLAAVYQMHKNERPDGAESNVAPEFIANGAAADCAGHPIHLRVASDAKSYVVSVPSTKHERKFETVAK